ncbi:S1 family peptidase [Pseudomethylobacillus aquaticus]|nr:trypsin-like peptidase domain-containing protein [Pseudomethylobacillus aquaticus]
MLRTYALAWAGLLGSLSLLTSGLAHAGLSNEELTHLSSSVVKVRTETRLGDQGIGSGAVVSPNHVATSCHVIAGARGVSISKFGKSFAPVAVKADWKRDLCILKFDDLPLAAIPLGDSEELRYEQEVIAVGFPNNARKPQPSFGSIKALYPMDDSVIIRTSAGFRIGSSGGALLNDEGKLIGLTTFKSPGRSSYFYSLPVAWVKQLLDAPDSTLTAADQPPFWAKPEAEWPMFMRVVTPLMTEQWAALEQLAQQWQQQERTNAEAHYYLGLAQQQQQKLNSAEQHLKQCIALNSLHAGAYYQLGLIALARGNQHEVTRIAGILDTLDSEAAAALGKAQEKPI